MRTVFRARLVVTFGAVALVACMPPYTMTSTMEPSRTCPDGATDPVEWFFPTERGDNANLERWCVTLGPVVIDSVPNAPFGPLTVGDSLAIGSWNRINRLNHRVSTLEDRLQGLE